jgi:hypothetical protein
MVGLDVEDACARWMAYGTARFMLGSEGGVSSMDVTAMTVTSVVTWKRLSDKYGEFDVQVGYLANKRRGKQFSGRLTVTVKPAGGNHYRFQVVDWASGYRADYLITVVGSDDSGYRAEEAVRPGRRRPQYDDDDDVPV